MKVSIIHPNAEKFRIRFERSDPDYVKCTWADILIDHDAYAITAQTDCGDYSYRWSITPSESFRDLCLRMLRDEEYLLEKFSDRTEFSLDESKLLFADYHPDPKDKSDVQAVNAFEADTEEAWISALEAIGISEPWEYIVMEYPPRAVTFVRMLKNIVLPEMRKEHENT